MILSHPEPIPFPNNPSGTNLPIRLQLTLVLTKAWQSDYFSLDGISPSTIVVVVVVSRKGLMAKQTIWIKLAVLQPLQIRLDHTLSLTRQLNKHTIGIA